MGTDMPMVDNTETLGIGDAKTDAGTLVVFMPKASKHIKKEELQSAVDKVLKVADGMDTCVDDPRDEPTPLNSLYPLNDHIQALDWVLLKAKEIQLCV